MRKTGISVVGDMPWGTHFCHFYETREDLLDTLVPYFKAGLEDHEFCLCVIAEPLTEDEVLSALRQAVRALDRRIADGNIELVLAREWYLAGGAFDPGRVHRAWVDKLGQALAKGHPGMRACGQVAWLEKKDWQAFCEYEAALDATIANQSMTLLCAYPLAATNAGELLDVARSHQFAIARRRGRWEVIETPELKQVKEEIKRLKKALEQLRRSEAHLLEGERIATIGSWVWNPSIEERFASRENFRIFGFDPDTTTLSSETERMSWERIHPEDRDRVMQAFEKAVREGSDFDHQYRLLLPDGTLKYVHTVGHARSQGGDRHESLSGTIMDVTQRKRAEAELQRSEAYLADGQRISHTGSWAWNASSGDLFWSLEHFRIFGLDPAEATPSYERFWPLVHPEDRPSVKEAFDSAVREKKDYEADYRIVRPDGTVKHIHGVGHPVFDKAGALIEYVGTVLDTTERRQFEEALDKVQAQLAHVTRVATMGELASSLAHELSQPLAAIFTNGGACLRWLRRDPPDLDEAVQAVERMIRDADRAGNVIARTRALLKKSGGGEKSPIDVAAMIREVLVFVHAEVTRNHIVVREELAEDLPPVRGARAELQQVVINLIMNGIEAMTDVSDRSRELMIRATHHDVEGTPGVLVAVQDAGVGIAQELDLFEPFYTSKTHGLGMGLSISRSIIQAHGGRVWASTNSDHGATFRFVLPAARS